MPRPHPSSGRRRGARSDAPAPEAGAPVETARPCCRCRGSRAGSSPGPAVRTRRSATASRSRSCSPRRGRAGSGLDRARGRPAAGRRHRRRVRDPGRRGPRLAGRGGCGSASATRSVPSVRWLGGVAIWAVELTARGAMVPLLRRRTRRSQSARRVERFVLGALDAGARRRRTARRAWPTRCRARCAPSTARSTRGR